MHIDSRVSSLIVAAVVGVWLYMTARGVEVPPGLSAIALGAAGAAVAQVTTKREKDSGDQE